MSDTKKDLYRYNGPVYHIDGYKLVDSIQVATLAVSEPKAISNIKYHARKQLGLKYNTPIDIVRDCLYIEPADSGLVDASVEPSMEPGEKPGRFPKNYSDELIVDYDFNRTTKDYCSHCGYMLNDQGECPVCDLGDEDLLRK